MLLGRDGERRLGFGILIPLSPLEISPTRFGPDAAPLLEEERNILDATLVAQFQGPSLLHRARLRAALATDDRPVDSGKVDSAHRADQRLKRDELYRRA